MFLCKTINRLYAISIVVVSKVHNEFSEVKYSAVVKSIEEADNTVCYSKKCGFMHMMVDNT